MADEVIELDEYRPHMVGVGICGACGHATFDVVPAYDRRERVLFGSACAACHQRTVVILPERLITGEAALMEQLFGPPVTDDEA